MPVDSISIRVFIGIVQAFVQPGICMFIEFVCQLLPLIVRSSGQIGAAPI
jgi:hypothetical protein